MASTSMTHSRFFRHTVTRPPSTRAAKVRVFPMLLTVLVVGLVLVRSTPAGTAGNPSASGHIDLTGNPLPDVYSFAAIQHQDGTVTGQAEILIQPNDERVHVAIDCMTIVGNTASISGTVTRSEGALTEGTRAGFTVTDNGEGANSPPDEGSFILFGLLFAPCPPLQRPTTPSERGNVQVRP